MSLYSENVQLERQYGSKALKRILKLSDTLGFVYGPETDTLVDLTNTQFESFLKAISFDKNAYDRANQQAAQKKAEKKRAREMKKAETDQNNEENIPM